MNGELICLSSDDEEPSPKKFKFDSIQQNHKEENKKKEKLNDSVICLDSDEDNNSEDLIIVNKENLDTNGSTESHQNNSADAVNPIEVVSCSRSFTLDSSSELSDINKDTDESENEQSVSLLIQNIMQRKKSFLVNNKLINLKCKVILLLPNIVIYWRILKIYRKKP